MPERHPAGVPVGGQFAAGHRGESDVPLPVRQDSPLDGVIDRLEAGVDRELEDRPGESAEDRLRRLRKIENRIERMATNLGIASNEAGIRAISESAQSLPENVRALAIVGAHGDVEDARDVFFLTDDGKVNDPDDLGLQSEGFDLSDQWSDTVGRELLSQREHQGLIEPHHAYGFDQTGQGGWEDVCLILPIAGRDATSAEG